MSEIAIACQPDVILAPFLTKSVPKDVFTHPTVPCIIVHPGIEGDRGRHSLDWALHSQQTEWGVTLLQAAEEMDAGKCLGAWTCGWFVKKTKLYCNINVVCCEGGVEKKKAYTTQTVSYGLTCAFEL